MPDEDDLLIYDYGTAVKTNRGKLVVEWFVKAVTEQARQYQLVWWGLRSWRFGIVVPKDSLRLVYRWRIRVGPLEIRKWRRWR
jgi:hypothetical protein